MKAWWKECPYSENDFLLNFVNMRLNSPMVMHQVNLWNPPPLGVLRFNIGGSSHGTPGRSNIGGVITNSSKQALGVFSKAMGDWWAYEAKVKVILHALIFCYQFQLNHVFIERDSSLAVIWVNCKLNRQWKLIQDINLIGLLCIEVDCIGVNHVYRESNHIADYLVQSLAAIG